MWRDKKIKLKPLSCFSLKRSAALLIFILFVSSCGNQEKQHQKESEPVKYTCAMHPQIIKDAPGNCPICGMELMVLHQNNLEIEIDSSLKNNIKPSNQTVLSNIKTYRVKQDSIADTIYLNGTIKYNTNQLNSISSRISGRIEKLYVHYNFEKISKGQKLMEIYSPELVAAQQELIFLNKNSDMALLQQAKQKLRLLGLSEAQLQQILKSGKVNYKIPIYSNIDGYLIDAKMLDLANKPNEQKDNDINQTAITLLEGQYVKTGDLLFKLFNDHQVWAEFYVAAAKIGNIKQNNPISIISKNLSVNAKIDLIQAYYNQGQPFNVIRVVLNNPHQNFKIGQLLKAQINIQPKVGLYIPESSVYQSGTKSIVFVKNGNSLNAKTVLLSNKVKSYFIVAEGLKAGDEIASNASYLVDTESFIEIPRT